MITICFSGEEGGGGGVKEEKVREGKQRSSGIFLLQRLSRLGWGFLNDSSLGVVEFFPALFSLRLSLSSKWLRQTVFTLGIVNPLGLRLRWDVCNLLVFLLVGPRQGGVPRHYYSV